MKNGFMTVASAVPQVRVADCEYNVLQIENMIAQAEGRGAEVLCLPELCLTGYTCQDLFAQQVLLEKADAALMILLDFTRKLDVITIVGMPVAVGGLLLNCAVVIQKGVILGVVPKTYLPNYKEFYEKRWFTSAQGLADTDVWLGGSTVTVSNRPQLFRTCEGVTFGVELCEDLWAPTPPSNQLSLAGAEIIFNLSASNELVGKHQYLLSLLKGQSTRMIAGYVYSSAGFGESSQDLVYGGNAIICENGKVIDEGQRFSLREQLVVNQIDIDLLRAERRQNTSFASAVDAMHRQVPSLKAEVHVCKEITPRDFELLRKVNPHPFVPTGAALDERCDEIFNIQVSGLAKRLSHTGCQKVVLGISGGLDSTLALLVCVRTFDYLGLSRSGIVGVTMPGFGTTDRTYANALSMMRLLGVTVREVSIRAAVEQHFRDINHDAGVHDVTYENSQARERTQILMDLSNQLSALVVGTGDLSELALGWATYNGDHMSMYGVNAGVPKTLVRHLVAWFAQKQEDTLRQTLLDVCATPVSPELMPADEEGNIKQKTEDLVGPYELHDFFLYHTLRHGFTPSRILLLARHAFDGGPEASFYDEETIRKWLQVFFRRFFSQQFKRSCLPDGPKVGSCSLSPRGDWRMPSDASGKGWEILEN